MTRPKNVVEVRKPGFYQDTDGDYWLKTQEGIWLYSDMMWGDKFLFATTSNVSEDPEKLQLRRISPSELDCEFTQNEFDDPDEWEERLCEGGDDDQE